MANSKASEWADRASGAFSGLKDRFTGNGGSSRRDSYDDYGYDDDYAYDDYGEYGYDPEVDGDYETSSVGPVSTRSVDTGSRYSSNPRLVSMDDARASVTGRAASDVTMRTPSYRQTDTATGYRSASTATAGGTRTRGYDSLFSSTAASDTAGSAATTASKTPVYQIPLTKPAGSRNLEIVRPKEYGDVADVAAVLKKGDAVILSLKMAPSAISSRVLDFAFGVASALDANVECIGDKVFFVVRGEGVSDAEREKLRLQGVVH